MMARLGYEQSKVDSALYFKEGVIVAVYVDDLLVAGASNSQVEEEVQGLRKFGEVRGVQVETGP